MPTQGEATSTKGKKVRGTFLYLREVAKQFDVHTSTILRWVRDGKVKVTGYKDRRGHWVYREADLGKFEAYARSIQPAS